MPMLTGSEYERLRSGVRREAFRDAGWFAGYVVLIAACAVLPFTCACAKPAPTQRLDEYRWSLHVFEQMTAPCPERDALEAGR